MSNNQNSLEGINIYTMTLMGKIDGYVVPREEYEKVFANYLPVAKNVNTRTGEKAVKRRKAHGKFANQYTIVVPVNANTTLNCKIFRNGTIQVSGAKSMSDAYALRDHLCRVSGMNAREFQIVMANASMKIGAALKMVELAQFFRSYGMHVKYDTLRHPGLHQDAAGCSG